MFAKVFEQIFDSSIAEDWRVRLVFEDLLKLCDRDGVVDRLPEAIARRTNVPLEMITHALAVLEQPDPRSRNQEHEGRRIVRVCEHRDWGWRIVNYTRYRDIASDDQRREKNLQAVHRYRARRKAGAQAAEGAGLPKEDEREQYGAPAAGQDEMSFAAKTQEGVREGGARGINRTLPTKRCPLPPHPSPLPKGEGEIVPASGQDTGNGFARVQSHDANSALAEVWHERAGAVPDENCGKAKVLETQRRSQTAATGETTLAGSARCEARPPTAFENIQRLATLDVAATGDGRAPAPVRRLEPGHLDAPAQPKQLSRSQKLLADMTESCLGNQWVNDAGKWIGRIKANYVKSARVLAELDNAIKEGRILTTPAQYAEDAWVRFAG